MRFELYKGKGKQRWRWRLVARNGKIIADSGESYTRRIDAIKTVLLLKRKTSSARLVFP